MEIKKCENSVLKLLKGYNKEEVVEIVDGLFKAKNGGSGYGSRDRRLQETLPPEKKRPNIHTKIDASTMDTLKTHVHSFLEDRHPPKVKIMTFAEALVNLRNPKLKPNTKPKATRKHRHSRPGSAFPQAKAAASRRNRKPTNISDSTSASAKSNAKSKPSISYKQTTTPLPQILQKVSLDLHEKQTVSKLSEPPKVSDSKQSTRTVCFGKAAGSSILELSLRTKTAARSAELETRFSAQQNKLHGRDSPNVKHKQEEAAARLKRTRDNEGKAAAQLKSIRDKERVAARLALRKVEEAADGRDSMSIFLELQALCDCDFQEYPKGYYPLQLFGLILKQ